jgi:hypothetical protein
MTKLGPEIEAKHRTFIQEAKEIGVKYLEQVQQGLAAQQYNTQHMAYLPAFPTFYQK